MQFLDSREENTMLRLKDKTWNEPWIVPENAGDSHHETDGMETNAAKGVDGSILAALDTYMSPLLIAEEETFTCLGV